MSASLLAMLQVGAAAAGGLVTPEETAEAHAWVAAKMGGQQAPSPRPALVVRANNDPVQANARGGKPMRIGDKEYTRGLYCHAVSKVEVALPGPARSFSAVVGVDSNEQTRGGRGSVLFTVSAAGKTLFRSPVMREGMPGAPVQVDLAGATDLVLEVGDAGDGIACDQADWADAQVTLQDGTTLWLGDLPLVDATKQSGVTTEPFFSFTYGGKPSAELLPKWRREHTTRKLDEGRTAHTLTYTDPETGLVVRCEAVEYADFPTVEWTLHLKNTGARETPILEGILPLDTEWQRTGGADFLLHHNTGSPANRTDFGVLQTPLPAGATKRISAAGGRSTNSDLSYFNLEWGGQGRIVVVGWPGQWSSEFARDHTIGIRTRAGQELTHFKLLPGEEVRTPLIAVQFWQGGDWIRAQNVWRRWMLAYGMTRPGGKPPKFALRASSSRAYEEMIGANEANQLMHLDRYAEEKLGLNTWWMDAGWYPQEHGWPQVGTWDVDRKRFPRGFKPISERAHALGFEILVWFEPERVAGGTWLTQNHPEWILGGAGGGLLNLGNPDARKWLTDHVDRLLTEEGIDVYRQDFNMDPLGYWRGNDAPDRQGITEIRHVEGLLAYWDELRRRHPDLLIDTCASGGRRVDLETIRRAVPLWRSDYAFEPVGHQGQTYGLSLWLPYHGTGTVAHGGAGYYGGGASPVEPYAFWSNAAPSLGLGIDVRVKELDYAALRKLTSQWRRVTPYYYGDFYPLTPYSLDEAAWIGWQFDRPDLGEGVAMLFRRGASFYEAARLKLRGLDPRATYLLEDTDGSAPVKVPGRELLENGLLVTLKQPSSAAVVFYRKAE